MKKVIEMKKVDTILVHNMCKYIYQWKYDYHEAMWSSKYVYCNTNRAKVDASAEDPSPDLWHDGNPLI
jgi:hypothetical protein